MRYILDWYSRTHWHGPRTFPRNTLCTRLHHPRRTCCLHTSIPIRIVPLADLDTPRTQCPTICREDMWRIYPFPWQLIRTCLHIREYLYENWKKIPPTKMKNILQLHISNTNNVHRRVETLPHFSSDTRGYTHGVIQIVSLIQIRALTNDEITWSFQDMTSNRRCLFNQ